MMNEKGKQVWRYPRKETSLNNRVFLWQFRHHAFGFDNSEITEHWDPSYWENKARRNPVMDTGYGCSNWALQFGDLGSDNQNSFPVSWFWPHLGSADAQAQTVPAEGDSWASCAVLLSCSLMGPVLTQPHHPTPISSYWIHQIAKTLLPFESYCLPII